jgi:hypothetical protein
MTAPANKSSEEPRVSPPLPPGAREYALERTHGAQGAKRRNHLVFATTLRESSVDFDQYESLLRRLASQ